MVAQESVSRMSTAGDQPELAVKNVSQSWQSAESFYYGNPLAQRIHLSAARRTDGATAQLSAVQPLTDPVSQSVGLRPEAIESSEPEAVMAQSPYRTGYESTGDTSGEENHQRPDGQPAPEGSVSSSRATECTSTGDLAMLDSIRLAAADTLPPIADLEPPSADTFDPQQAGTLPPPAPRKSVPDAVVPLDALPPWQQTYARGPFESADSPVVGTMPGGGSDATISSDNRYIDPEQLVRERAIERGQQRQQRIEARRRLGYSPLRPPVFASPFTSAAQPRPIFIIMPTVVVQEANSEAER
jgi:hypothetical protein